MTYSVAVSHYQTGTGHSYTEQMDSGVTHGLFTAEEWNDGLDEPFQDAPDSWVEINVAIYADGDDPMFDEPIYTSSLTI